MCWFKALGKCTCLGKMWTIIAIVYTVSPLAVWHNSCVLNGFVLCQWPVNRQHMHNQHQNPIDLHPIYILLTNCKTNKPGTVQAVCVSIKNYYM